MAISEVLAPRVIRGLAYSPTPFALICFSALYLPAAFFTPQPAQGFLLGAGAGLIALAIITVAARFLSAARSGLQVHAALWSSGNDPCPVLVSDLEGTIVGTNPCARATGPCTQIQDSIKAHVAAPTAAIRRIVALALLNGHATETFGENGLARVSVIRLGSDKLTWRIEDSAAGAKQTTPKSVQAPVPSISPVEKSPDKAEAKSETESELLNALPVPMLKIAVDGTIRSANAQARKLLAVNDRPIPPLFDLVEGMGRPIKDWLADAAKGRGLLKPEIVRALVPGQDLFLQITLGRVDEDGDVLLIAVLNDATELKSLEAQFVQSQKMQAIGQLAGGVAHDFNNLLTAISGHCDLMLLRHDQQDPDYADLKQIEQNANRAASLVGQLLAFSRKQNLKPQVIDLRDTLSDLTHLLNRLVGEKVQLELTHESGPATIRADCRQLEQVIMNLVVNARDAMTGGGRIAITTYTECLTVPLSRDRVEVPVGEYVVVEVADQGVGIEPEVLPKIFEPFYTTKKTGEGTGLGLSTAYGIVKQTGGYIFADSVRGKGTTFSLYFPKLAPSEERIVVAETPKMPASEARSDGVVLLVEDEAPVRAFASRALRMRGFTVLEAESAEVALKKLDDDDLCVDVFVTDVIMPKMDGPTWVRKALEKRPNTRVVFVSGYAEEGLAESQSRVPNSVFLPKPFSLTQLTTVVQSQMR